VRGKEKGAGVERVEGIVIAVPKAKRVEWMAWNA
jgi:hypothetical protein